MPAPGVQVCIDLFVMSSSYVDVATLSRLCHPTAGQLYHYCPWVPEIDASRVANDLRWNLYRPQVCPAAAALPQTAEATNLGHAICSPLALGPSRQDLGCGMFLGCLPALTAHYRLQACAEAQSSALDLCWQAGVQQRQALG